MAPPYEILNWYGGRPIPAMPLPAPLYRQAQMNDYHVATKCSGTWCGRVHSERRFDSCAQNGNPVEFLIT